LAESPFGLAAWLFDHGDRYAQPAAAITSAVLGRTINGHSAGDLTRDDVLDNFTLYWLTNSAAAHFYWESDIILYNAADVSVPAAMSVFPGEKTIRPCGVGPRAPIISSSYNHVDRGERYAAWEQPQIFSAELRAAFRPIRRMNGPLRIHPLHPLL
jgi:hypothetical protein